MSKNGIPDATDKRIASALQLHGRAPWDQIAQVLGLSERTTARRGQRLLDEGMIRVIGVLDTQLIGRPAPVLLGLRVETGSARAIAASLSGLAETRTVMALCGSIDHFVEVIPESQSSLRTFLFDRLPAQVRSSSSYPVLRFYTGSHEWNGGALTEDEERALRQEPRSPFGGRSGVVDLHTEEHRITQLLARDGRMSTTRLAGELGVSQATASRRLAAVLEQGVVRIRADVAPSLFGLTTEALLWLRVSYRHLDEVGRTLSDRPEVMTLVSVSGSYQICAHVAVRDTHHLQAFLTDVVGALDAVSDIDVSILLETFKRGGFTLAAPSPAQGPTPDAPDCPPAAPEK